MRRHISFGVARALAPAVLLSLGLTAPQAAAQTEISLEKLTNGQDADTPPGPVVTVGSSVLWTYVVTNTGARDLTSIGVTDDQGVVVSCPGTTLAAGTSMTCTGSGTAKAGQYANVGTASGQLPDATTVSDSDPSHYFGQAAPAVTIEKATNGIDADTPPGPVVPVGSAVVWTYTVTNVGSDPLTDVVVADDQGVAVSCPGTTLAPGASMTCTGNGTAQAGQYANVGSVSATLPDESFVADSDPSHYFGQVLSLVKRTNGVESAVPPGPTIPPGAPVAWTYEVMNPGPATVTGLAVSDDQGVVVSCPVTALAAGESATCTGSGAAQPGQYVNVGTATATLPGGGLVSASDTSHYYSPPFSLEKRTNGLDVSGPPGPSVTVGSTVTFTYLVTNLGSEGLENVLVTDDQGVVVTCPKTTLAPAESMTCNASSLAVEGPYVNVGTATATTPGLETLTASDTSWHLGQPPALDFGDAPDPAYPTLLASNGARHLLGGGVFLGACVDAETDGLPTASAGGDDAVAGTAFGSCGTAGDDEDGVTFVGPLVAGATASVDVVASAPCVLSAWIDFAGNGGWGDATDELFPGGTALVAGTNGLSFTVPASAAPGTTFARFRCTTAGAVGLTGEASDGEVEDYAVEVLPAPPSVSATKLVALQVDVNRDRSAGAGDTLRYTITILNAGPGDALAVSFADTPDPNTSLVNGSVTTTAGTVASGNAAGETTVTVDVGTLPALGGSATIAFDVVIRDPLAPSVRQVVNAGTVTGGNFASTPTDDPAAPGPADPTAIAVALAAAAIPALGGPALWALLALVALAGARKLAG